MLNVIILTNTKTLIATDLTTMFMIMTDLVLFETELVTQWRMTSWPIVPYRSFSVTSRGFLMVIAMKTKDQLKQLHKYKYTKKYKCIIGHLMSIRLAGKEATSS